MVMQRNSLFTGLRNISKLKICEDGPAVCIYDMWSVHSPKDLISVWEGGIHMVSRTVISIACDRQRAHVVAQGSCIIAREY